MGELTSKTVSKPLITPDEKVFHPRPISARMIIITRNNVNRPIA
jgi:hypothetical protein